jgi:hypothetical protein
MTLIKTITQKAMVNLCSETDIQDQFDTPEHSIKQNEPRLSREMTKF